MNDTVGLPAPTLWVTVTDASDTAPNSVFIPDQNGISDKYLISRNIAINSTSPVLTFRNNYNTEYDPPPAEVFWDGGVLEVSAPNISNGDFTDVTDPLVGGSIPTRLQGKYLESPRTRWLGEGRGVAIRGLHQHCGESGTEPERTDDQAALSDGNRRGGKPSRVVR
jgi:hypothetical protein